MTSKFNFSHWSEAYTDSVDGAWNLGAPVTSVFDIIHRERWLEYNSDELVNVPRVPVIYYVHGFGEPSASTQTKVGGVPHRDANHPWPCNASGEPMEFLGQINLSDCRDLVPEAMADLLLIFQEGEDACTTDEFHFEWGELNVLEPCTASTVPNIEYPSIEAPVYFEAFRTTDYEFSPTVTDDIRQFASLSVTKLGGLPDYFDDGEPAMPGRFFLAIESLQISLDRLAPAVNHPHNITEAEADGAYAKNFLMFGDLGTLFFNIEPDGTIHGCGQCH